MPATAKKPSVVEAGPADDNPRSALAAAIAAHTASRKAVELTRNKQSVEPWMGSKRQRKNLNEAVPM